MRRNILAFLCGLIIDSTLLALRIGLMGLGLLLPAVALFFWARNRLAESQLGVPLVAVEPSVCRPGDGVRLTLRLKPPKAVQINRVRAVLSAVEHIRGTDADGTFQTMTTVFRLPTQLEPEQSISMLRPASSRRLRLEPRREAVFAGSIEVPPNAPASFQLPNNRLFWTIEFHVDVAGWPDWKHKVPLVIVPARGSATSFQVEAQSRA